MQVTVFIEQVTYKKAFTAFYQDVPNKRYV